MKNTLLFIIIVSIVSTLGCGGDHALSPENECNIPSVLNSAKIGSMWIYKHTLLDSLGKPLTGVQANANYFDTLTLIGSNIPFAKDGVAALKLEDKYSNDGGITIRRDTVYWVITPSKFYVNSSKIQNRECNCFYNQSIKWRLYEDCDEQNVSMIDTVFRDDYPSMLPNGDTTRLIVEDTIKNTYKIFGKELVTVGTQSILAKKSQSFFAFLVRIVAPDSILFAWNNKRTSDVHDDRTVWTNRDLGVIKERALTSEETNTEYYNFPHSFERTLVKYSILK